MREYRYRVDAEGRVFHDGSEVLDPRTLRFFLRAMTHTPDGHWLVLCQGERNWFEAEGTPFVVQRVRPVARGDAQDGLDLVLAGDHVEPLDPATLASEDGRLYCRVRRGAFPARFGRVALQQPGEDLPPDPGGNLQALLHGRVHVLGRDGMDDGALLELPHEAGIDRVGHPGHGVLQLEKDGVAPEGRAGRDQEEPERASGMIDGHVLRRDGARRMPGEHGRLQAERVHEGHGVGGQVLRPVPGGGPVGVTVATVGESGCGGRSGPVSVCAAGSGGSTATSQPICASQAAAIEARMPSSSLNTMRAPRTGTWWSVSWINWPPGACRKPGRWPRAYSSAPRTSKR